MFGGGIVQARIQVEVVVVVVVTNPTLLAACPTTFPDVLLLFSTSRFAPSIRFMLPANRLLTIHTVKVQHGHPPQAKPTWVVLYLYLDLHSLSG